MSKIGLGLLVFISTLLSVGFGLLIITNGLLPVESGLLEIISSLCLAGIGSLTFVTGLFRVEIGLLKFAIDLLTEMSGLLKMRVAFSLSAWLRGKGWWARKGGGAVFLRARGKGILPLLARESRECRRNDKMIHADFEMGRLCARRCLVCLPMFVLHLMPGMV